MNVKVILPVALVALSSLLWSTPAAATELTTGAYPATATSGASAGIETFNTEAGSVKCDTSYTAELTEGSSTVAVSPSFSNCSAFGFLSATVDPEECEYVLHAGEEVETGKYAATADLVCPEGQAVRITAASCEADVEAQEGLSTVYVTNGEGSPAALEVEPEIAEINYVVTKDGLFCPFSGTGEKEGAELTSSEPLTATAEVEETVQVGLDVG